MYITKQSDYNMLKFKFPPGFRLDVVRKQTGSNSADKHQQQFSTGRARSKGSPGKELFKCTMRFIYTYGTNKITFV